MPSHLGFFDRLYLHLFYLKRRWIFDLPENQVGWRSRYNQEIRFQVLSGIGDLNGKKILDLGCGLGCFYQFLKAKGWSGNYTGFDLLDLMVQKARRRFPDVRFERRDILQNPPREQWDYVFVSGIFNHRIKDNWAWIEQTVQACLALSTRGLAFNLLNLEGGWLDSELFYARPEVFEEKVKLWSGGKYKIVKNYLPEDMTAYLYQ